MPPTTPRSSTLVAHALWGGITDAETGETLELRQRKWEFPVQKRGEATLPPCSGRDDNHRRQTSGDIKSDARQDQSYGGEGEENLFSEFNRFHRDSSLVPDQEESTRNAPIYSEAVSVEAKRDFGGYSGTPKSMKLPFEGRGTSQAFRSLNASSGLCLLNGQGEDGILPTFEEREHEPQTPPSTEPMHSPFWMPTPQKPPFLGTSRELRALAGAQSPGKKAGEERDLREHGKSARKCKYFEAVSPFPCRNLHELSPSRSLTTSTGLPPSQQLGSCELPQTTIDGGIEDRSLTLADIGSVTARRSGSMGFTANGSDCAMTTKALSRDTQRKMVLIQNIRDRYLRYVFSAALRWCRHTWKSAAVGFQPITGGIVSTFKLTVIGTQTKHAHSWTMLARCEEGIPTHTLGGTLLVLSFFKVRNCSSTPLSYHNPPIRV